MSLFEIIYVAIYIYIYIYIYIQANDFAGMVYSVGLPFLSYKTTQYINALCMKLQEV